MLAEFGGILRKNNLTQQTEQLQKYKEWLLAEKDCASSSNREICEAFDDKLQDVQLELAVVEEKLQFTFPWDRTDSELGELIQISSVCPKMGDTEIP